MLANFLNDPRSGKTPTVGISVRFVFSVQLQQFYNECIPAPFPFDVLAFTLFPVHVDGHEPVERLCSFSRVSNQLSCFHHRSCRISLLPYFCTVENRTGYDDRQIETPFKRFHPAALTLSLLNYVRILNCVSA